MRRYVGKKAFELEGNAVLGYSVHFDLDKLGGYVIARGYGTAIKILPKQPKSFSLEEPILTQTTSSPRILSFDNSTQLMRARSFKPDSRNLGREASTLTVLTRGGSNDEVAQVATQSQSVQILTLKSMPEGSRMMIGGYVTAHAVKLLVGKRTAAKWDSWWKDVRDEVSIGDMCWSLTHWMIGKDACTGTWLFACGWVFRELCHTWGLVYHLRLWVCGYSAA